MERTPENLQKLKLLVNSFNSFVAGSMINADLSAPATVSFTEESIIPKMEQFLIDNKIDDLYEVDNSKIVPFIRDKQVDASL